MSSINFVFTLGTSVPSLGTDIRNLGTHIRNLGTNFRYTDYQLSEQRLQCPVTSAALECLIVDPVLNQILFVFIYLVFEDFRRVGQIVFGVLEEIS
mgnify:CR=1 FL=1